MARQPKDENNALRQLRGVLASSGRTRISQIELAQICGISNNTIKKIEFGSRQLNPSVLTKVAIATSARWDDEQRRWTRYDKAPFTYADFSEHRRKMLDPSALDEAIRSVIVAQIHSRIDWLFENVPTKSWGILRVLVDESLEKCKRDLKLTKNDALFYRPTWLDSANESAAAEPVRPSQQKREYTSSGRGPRGAIAGDKRRKRKYGP